MPYTDFIALYVLCRVKHRNTKKNYKPISYIYLYFLMNTLMWFSEMLSKIIEIAWADKLTHICASDKKNNNNLSFFESLRLRTRPPAGPRIHRAEARWKNPTAAGEQCLGFRHWNGPLRVNYASQTSRSWSRTGKCNP